MYKKIWKNFLFFFPNNNKSLVATNGIEEFLVSSRVIWFATLILKFEIMVWIKFEESNNFVRKLKSNNNDNSDDNASWPVMPHFQILLFLFQATCEKLPSGKLICHYFGPCSSWSIKILFVKDTKRIIQTPQRYKISYSVLKIFREWAKWTNKIFFNRRRKILYLQVAM